MTNPSRTWTIVGNTAFNNQTSQDAQYREAAYTVYATLLAAGWTVVKSSDGTTAGSSDYWSATGPYGAAGATLEINTTGNGAWIVMQSPTAFLDSGNVQVLVAMNASSGTPQNMPITMTHGTFTSTAGSVTAVPTSTATTTTATSNNSILTWSTMTSGRYATWRSSRGDVRVAVKVEGASAWVSVFEISSNIDSSGGGKAAKRVWMRQAGNAGDCNTQSFIGASYVKSIAGDGTTSATTSYQSTVWGGAANMTSGVDGQGETYFESIMVWGDAASAGRYLGQFIDVYAAPTALTFGEVDSTEGSQTYRRVSMGDFWWYWPTASLPIL